MMITPTMIARVAVRMPPRKASTRLRRSDQIASPFFGRPYAC